VKDKREELMRRIAGNVNKEGKEYGLEVVDVRLKRADLPQENQKSVFERMKADRVREATELRAQGEADAAAVQMTAQRPGGLLRGRHVLRIRQDHGEGMTVDVTHEVGIELAGAASGVFALKILADLPRTAGIKPPTAALPEQELDDALDVAEIQRKVRRARREDDGFEEGDRAIGPLQREAQRSGTGVLGQFAEGAIVERRGKKRRIQRGRDLHLHGDGVGG